MNLRENEILMLTTRFETHFHPARVDVTITFNDDETITARIVHDAMRVTTYTFEITSDDDAYVFINDDDPDDVITYEIECDD